MIPGLGRSPGEGKGYPFQYSGLENSMDCIVHGVAKGQTQLSNFHFHSSSEDTTYSTLEANSILPFFIKFCSDYKSNAHVFKSTLHFSSVAQSCPTLCDPMDCSMPGFPVHHQLSEPTQTHVHCVGDAVQPSHPLSSPSPPAFNLSQHQSFSSELALRIRSPVS